MGLLAPGEGPAVTARDGAGDLVIVCEHASNRLPESLGTLGLTAADLERHIAWDPGAAEIAKGLAARFRAGLVMQRYSRLAIDCNRDPSLPDAIATVSETTVIPGNANLSEAERQERIAALWRPFHDGLAGLLDRREAAGRPTTLVTIHTFTPVYRGVSRPWHAGIISTDKRELAEAMLAGLRREAGLVVGDNQPYSAKDNVDYTIRRHGRDRGLPHVMIEIRNDLLREAGDVAAWTTRLADALDGSAKGVRGA
jgi:predicted N-formylglutamate amidohydrolase